MTAKKGRTAAPERRTGNGMDVYEKAMKALGKRDYERALELLDSLIEAHPEEKELLERARAYRALCARSVEKKPSFRPKTFEEMLNHGVYLHNKGEYEEALKFLRQAADIHPRNEHVLYCLAATAARAGDTGAALKSLKQAIAANPANRMQARGDSDFDALRDEDEFQSLIRSQAS